MKTLSHENIITRTEPLKALDFSF